MTETIVNELPMSLEPELIYISGGTFLMGSPDGEGYDDEHPQHEVTIQPFYMGKYPITQAQYEAVMGKNPSYFSGNPQNPVEQINWFEAVEFCKQLSRLTGRNYRLPSEAEWEYACRAGTQTPFFFGDDENQLKDYAWYCDNSNRKTHPVGQFLPNAFGLYDMYGNVWEWCADTWHSNYEGAPTDGSAWTKKGSIKRSLLRGGSWNSIPYYYRSAYRCNYIKRGYSNQDVGFRAVCGSGRN